MLHRRMLWAGATSGVGSLPIMVALVILFRVQLTASSTSFASLDFMGMRYVLTIDGNFCVL